VAPVVSAQNVTATDDGASHAVATFTGTSPSYLVNDNDTVATGAAFTDTDYTAHHRVALLGTTVATALVGGDGTAIVGQTVQFNGVAFQVVGLLGAKGSSGPQDQDDRVVVPLTAGQDTLTGDGAITSISAKATSADTVAAAQAEVTTILADRHQVSTDNPNFSIFNPSSIQAAVSSTVSTFTLLLGAVAAISLLVGGLGVMNIMLVTVTERTREIGIRKAIGAQRADIVGQFLLEAVLLSMCGGLIGVAIGVGVGQLSVGGFQLVGTVLGRAGVRGVRRDRAVLRRLPASRAAALRRSTPSGTSEVRPVPLPSSLRTRTSRTGRTGGQRPVPSREAPRKTNRLGGARRTARGRQVRRQRARAEAPRHRLPRRRPEPDAEPEVRPAPEPEGPRAGRAGERGTGGADTPLVVGTVRTVDGRHRGHRPSGAIVRSRPRTATSPRAARWPAYNAPVSVTGTRAVGSVTATSVTVTR
jgi:putative ABC transport system permease protein